jgi:hydrogenase maturation protease
MENKRRVVLGLGNLLQKDEGFGVRVVQALEAELGVELRRAGIELVDGGTLGLNLLPLVEECEALLVLDAVEAGAAPGALVELSKEQIPLLLGIKLSQHQVTFQEVLALAQVRGYLPERIHLIGAQPAVIAAGLELSDPVEAQLPEAIERAVEMLREWGIFA